MNRKIKGMVAPFLCSMLLLAAPCVSVFARQPSPPSQETVSDNPTADFSQDMTDPQQSVSDDIETVSKSNKQMETDFKDTEPETENVSSASTELESEALMPETNRDEITEPKPEDSIILIQPESAIDADGNVTMTVNTTENLVLPVTMTMKGSEGLISMTVNRSGQQIKIKPDTYDITKAVDGNGKKLPSGAVLTIPKEGGIIYLDFNKPDSGENTWVSFLKTNCLFLFIAFILAFIYQKYFRS